MELSHLNENGEASMVDIGEKQVTARYALAQAVLKMQPETLLLITSNGLPKGDAFAAARIAGIMAAKKTNELIPLCHNIPIDSVEITFNVVEPDTLIILAAANCNYKTGIEMEALIAASVAALTVYDMCKAVDRGMTVSEVKLLEKRGGRSGTYKA
jgi:cyclic pyranopterin monophosphate synthase